MKKNVFFCPLFLLLMLLAVMLPGCSNGDSGGSGNQTVMEPLRGQISSFELNKMGSVEDVYSYLSDVSEKGDRSFWDDLWNKLKPYFKYGWHLYRVEYYTETAVGERIKVSGAVVVPVNTNHQDIQVPIMSLQHPTQVERKYSPSNLNVLDPQLTIPAGIAFCSTGYIVVIPDYPGMGINYDTHPYCHISLANSVVDMIRSVRDSKSYWHESADSTEWNNNLYLMGYSEGGYATMVTARDIQLNCSDELNVSAVTPLDGPYSLSDTMRKVMAGADSSYSAPYFLPYVIAGYESVYQSQTDVFDFERDVKSSVPDYTPPEGSTYAKELKKMLNGDFTGDQISDFMRKATPFEGPVSILTDIFVEEINQTSGTVYDTLSENDAYYGWTPSMPMKLFHNEYDDLVPVGNADNAMIAFSGLNNVTMEKFKEYIPGIGSIHAGALPVAYYKGFMWLDQYAYPERHQE